ncbi:MAG: RNA polymerase sigma factor [Planctomycetota bacterium]|jgi:RNA polymerase sigma-70 factor (ECF subfamily)
MDAATLLEHREFVLRVARALLRDEADVEDAVQDTYVAALQSAPPRTGRVRPWLGGIVRNMAKNRMRREGRRRAREFAVARKEGVADSSERLRWQQRVVEAVLALDPIYRDVIVLRFFEELPPRAVAERLEMPVNTVRTRTRRAVEKLRAVFDAKYGGRKAWTVALGGLLLVKPASAGGAKLVTAALVLVLGTTGALWHVARDTEAESPVSRTAAARGSSTSDSSTAPGATSSGAANKTAAEWTPTRFHGRLHIGGTLPWQPLSGARVHLVDRARRGYLKTWPALATSELSDAEGRFSIDWNKRWSATHDHEGNLYYLLYVERDGVWTDALYARPEGFFDGMDLSVELVPNTRFQFVRGPSRAPIVGAKLSLHVPASSNNPRQGPAVSEATTDRSGFATPSWPAWLNLALLRLELPDGEVLAWTLGLNEARSFDPYDLDLSESEIATVRARVLDRDGNAAGAGVKVAVFGQWSPDGVSAEGSYTPRMGAVDRPLMGVTDARGELVWRFPADRARHGCYLFGSMVAYELTADRVRYIDWTMMRTKGMQHADTATQSGETLPLIRFGSQNSGIAQFGVRGERTGDVELFWRSRGAATSRLWISRMRTLTQAGHRVEVWQLDEAAPVAARDGEVAVFAHRGERSTYRVLSEAEFGRCLRWETTIDGGATVPLVMTNVRLVDRTGDPVPDATLLLESEGAAYFADEETGSNGVAQFQLPAVPGHWRVSVDGRRLQGEGIRVEGGATVTVKAP